MAIPIPLPKGSWEGGHDLSPSLLGEENLPSRYELYKEAVQERVRDRGLHSDQVRVCLLYMSCV